MCRSTSMSAWSVSLRVALLTFVLVAGVQVCAAAECRAPAYRKGHVWEDSPTTIMMNIGIAADDFAPERLVCLATALRRQYANRKEILISMFDSHAAAKNCTSPTLGDGIGPRVNWCLRSHAYYRFDAGYHVEFLYIEPFGNRNHMFDTRIDLPVTASPSCTLEVDKRCLLALENIQYPWDALKAKESGTVNLEAVIARDGRVKGVRPSGQTRNDLVNFTLSNLRTWRFERAKRETPFRITYSYVLETSGNPGETGLSFDLPQTVEVRARPL